MVSVGGMTARGGFGPLFFCSSACCVCGGDGTQDIALFGAPVGVAVKKWWRGRPPLRPLAGVGALAGAPPRPRYWILRRPRRQRRGAPARRLAGAGGLLSRRRQRFNGGAVPPPLVRCGGCPSLRWVRWCLPGVGVGAVVVAPPRAGPFRSASLKAPGAAPPPVPAPLRLRARGGGSAGCGQRGRPPALAGGFTME